MSVDHTVPASDSGTLAKGKAVLPPTSRDDAVRLIIDIVQLLMVSDPSNQCHELKKGLIILHRALDLAELAIEAYQGTPLGRILNDTIGKEFDRCLEVLQALRSVIEAYWPTLVSTSLNFLQGRFLGSGCESDELATWRRKLSECQRSVVGCLQVLDSCVRL